MRFNQVYKSIDHFTHFDHVSCAQFSQNFPSMMRSPRTRITVHSSTWTADRVYTTFSSISSVCVGLFGSWKVTLSLSGKIGHFADFKLIKFKLKQIRKNFTIWKLSKFQANFLVKFLQYLALSKIWIRN